MFSLNRTFFVFICLNLWLILQCLSANAQPTAPGAPGKDAQWASAGKQGVGTSANLQSKIWFTLQGGALTEVYYPDVTAANVHKLEFVVVDPKTKKVETETGDATHEIKATRPDSLSFQQINRAKSGEWTITKTYTTDPERNSILIDVQFEPKNKKLNLYVYYDPSIDNRGMNNYAYHDSYALYAVNNNKISALMFSSKTSEATSGFYQISDGLEQLRTHGRIVETFPRAISRNLAQMAKIAAPRRFTAVLSFDSELEAVYLTALRSRLKGFAKCLTEYEKGWSDYVKTLRKVEPKYQAQFNMAAMVLKRQEDKTIRGANVASLTVLWGGGVNANGDVGGGYHLV